MHAASQRVQDKYAAVKRMWHPTANNELQPEDLSAGSNVTVTLLCQGCPTCGQKHTRTSRFDTIMRSAEIKCTACNSNAGAFCRCRSVAYAPRYIILICFPYLHWRNSHWLHWLQQCLEDLRLCNTCSGMDVSVCAGSWRLRLRRVSLHIRVLSRFEDWLGQKNHLPVMCVTKYSSTGAWACTRGLAASGSYMKNLQPAMKINWVSSIYK